MDVGLWGRSRRRDVVIVVELERWFDTAADGIERNIVLILQRVLQVLKMLWKMFKLLLLV